MRSDTAFAKWSADMSGTITELNTELAVVKALFEDLLSISEHTTMCPVSSHKWTGQKCRCMLGPIIERWKHLNNERYSTYP